MPEASPVEGERPPVGEGAAATAGAGWPSGTRPASQEPPRAEPPGPGSPAGGAYRGLPRQGAADASVETPDGSADAVAGTGRVGWPAPPPWRAFDGGPDLPAPPADDRATERLLGSARPSAPVDGEEADLVGAALCLSRPLLVVAPPSADAAAVAHRAARALGLGRVLHWTVTSGSTLRQGLWDSDAAPPDPRSRTGLRGRRRAGATLGLGPLGTALLPQRAPRVLFVDGLDRGPFDLPLELRRVFQDGAFPLPPGTREFRTADPGRSVRLTGPEVRCHAFPLVVLSVTGPEGLPGEFLTDCLQLALTPPDADDLLALAAAHVPDADPAVLADLARRFAERRREYPVLPVGRFLDAVHLVTSGTWPAPSEGPAAAELMNRLWRADRPGDA